MTPEQYRRIDSIFQKALELKGERQRQYLAAACGTNADLRSKVGSLLRADAGGGPARGFAGDAFKTNQFAEAVNQWHHPSRAEKKNMRRCSSGHYFDESRHQNCPYCPIHGLEMDQTRAYPQSAPSPPPNQSFWSGMGTSTASGTSDSATVSVGAGDDGVTQIYVGSRPGFNPVVGWLVCIGGPDRGRDYRIRSQRNFIGRDQRMDICISGDNEISRENHAEITYDPRGNAFRLAPGTARSLAYLNGALLEGPTVLRPLDLIELGQTHLRFVPFCGEGFQWE